MLLWGLSGYTHYVVKALSIVVIDLLLAGDNALVIAMAVRALPARQRRIALLAGAWGAVLIRIALTFVAAKLLQHQFIQFLGGAFVLWIAVRVMSDASDPEHVAVSQHGLWRAIGSVMIADVTMSADNILAIAGASGGNIWLIVFGLALSIPLVISSSTLLAKVMDRYPLTIYVGVAILGKVGGDMMINDPFIQHEFHPTELQHYALDALLIAAILIVGRLLSRRAGPRIENPAG
ncbi:MAG: TerC family protein [Bryobacteraceae bacterium]